MYESFFQLREKPFSLLPDTDYLYPGRKHGTALALLEYCLLGQDGFCVIWGEPGVGKTTLIRRLLSQYADRITMGLISNTQGSLGDLLGWVALAFGLDCQGRSRSQIYDDFRQFLTEQQARGRKTVLIIDEAQNLSAAMAAELRVLSKVGGGPSESLKIMLVGQPQLQTTLHAPGLEPFAQQVVVDYHLGSLDRSETDEYIRYRLTAAGGSPDILDDEACDAVFHYSGGVPRLINLLCDNALARAYAAKRAVVEADIVHEVIRDREAYGMLPLFAVRSVNEGVQQSMPAVAAAGALAEELRPVPTAGGGGGGGIQFPLRPSVTRLVSIEALPQVERRVATGNRVVRASETKPGLMTASAILPPTDGHGDPPQVQAGIGLDVDRERQSASKGGDVDEKLAAAAVERGEDMTNYRMVPVAADQRRPAWGLAVMLGLVAGLLIAVILIGAVYLDLGRQALPALQVPARQPVVAPSVAPPRAPVAAAAAVSAPAVATPAVAAPAKARNSAARARLRELRHERDAAIAETRALQKERDAALAVAQARERAAQAELQAALVEERAQAKLRQRADQELVKLSSARAAAQRHPKQITRMARPVVVRQPARPPVAIRHPVRSPVARVEPDSRTLKFSPNPCNGPAAKFLSTCKE